MAKHHDKKPKEDVVKIKPLTITDIVIKTVEKIVELPRAKFIEVEVEVERPKYVDKDFERPIIKDVEYERPVIQDKEYERPIPVDKEYERPVVKTVEVKVEVPKPVEVPYDVPKVAMEEVKTIVSEVTEMLNGIRSAQKEAYELLEVFKKAVRDVKAQIPKEIKVPKIIEEEVIVEKPKFVTKVIEIPRVKIRG